MSALQYRAANVIRIVITIVVRYSTSGLMNLQARPSLLVTILNDNVLNQGLHSLNTLVVPSDYYAAITASVESL